MSQITKIDLVTSLPQVLQNIIISYFTCKDLQTNGLFNIIDEKGWQEKVEVTFGHVIRQKGCKGLFRTWFYFYCHLEHITYCKATIVKLDEYVSVYNFGKEGYILSKDWKSKLTPKIYELVKDLEEGDIVITPNSYFVVRSRRGRRWLLLKTNIDKRESIHNFSMISDFPINYWKHSEDLHLSYSIIRVKTNIEQHLYYFIGNIFTWIRIFVLDNVAYAIISFAEDEYRGYTSRVKHYQFKVRPLLNYLDIFSNACIAKINNGPFEIQLPDLLKSYNITWDRVLLNNYY